MTCPECHGILHCASLVQISTSVQPTMAIVSIHAVTLVAVSRVAVDLATDWIVMADHAQVRGRQRHTVLILTLLRLFHQISTSVLKTVTTVNSCVVIMLVASHVAVDRATYQHLMEEAALVSTASTNEYVMCEYKIGELIWFNSSPSQTLMSVVRMGITASRHALTQEVVSHVVVGLVTD